MLHLACARFRLPTVQVDCGSMMGTAVFGRQLSALRSPTSPTRLIRIGSRLRMVAASLALRALRSISAKVFRRGFEVVLAFRTDDAGAVVQKIDDALSIIEDGDARRYQRIKSDLRSILVTKAGGPEFLRPLSACLLGYQLIKDATPLGLAFMIVHEAAHARLWRRGFGYEAQIRGRVERSCITEELRFAQAIGSSPKVIAWVREKLSNMDRWSAEGIEARRVTELNELGMPRWLQRLVRPSRVVAEKAPWERHI